MNKRDRDKRFAGLREIGCIACLLDGHGRLCGSVEIHHLNAHGHAGMPRRGDEFTIPLGAWAHRGAPLNGFTASEMKQHFGPSLARSSKEFRERYHDDDTLLAMTNARLRAL